MTIRIFQEIFARNLFAASLPDDPIREAEQFASSLALLMEETTKRFCPGLEVSVQVIVNHEAGGMTPDPKVEMVGLGKAESDHLRSALIPALKKCLGQKH